MGLTLQRDLAKFFFSCSETVAWMFRSLCLPVIQQCSRALLQKKKKSINNQHVFVFCLRAFTTKKKKHSKPTFASVFRFMYLFFAQGHSYQAKNFNLQHLYLCFLTMYLYFAQRHSYDRGKHQHGTNIKTLLHLCVSILDSCVHLIVMR